MLLIFTNFYLFLMKHTATLLKLTKIYRKFATVNWQNTIYKWRAFVIFYLCKFYRVKVIKVRRFALNAH
jgi:hypothetical protein